nr:MAG TPA: hypothetical protein [Caudoviricetes sp.]
MYCLNYTKRIQKIKKNILDKTKNYDTMRLS